MDTMPVSLLWLVDDNCASLAGSLLRSVPAVVADHDHAPHHALSLEILHRVCDAPFVVVRGECDRDGGVRERRGICTPLQPSLVRQHDQNVDDEQEQARGRRNAAVPQHRRDPRVERRLEASGKTDNRKGDTEIVDSDAEEPVSYTHLTLPTSDL